MGLGVAIVLGVPLVLGIAAFFFIRSRINKGEVEDRAANEASFSRAFPDLHPHFHPSKVLDHVLAQHGRSSAKPEFVTRRLGDYEFVKSGDGGELRIGKGSYRVHLDKPGMLRVHYTDADREFWWARTAQDGDHWQFVRGPGIKPTLPAREKSAA
jgi:hypothetical protein